MTDLKKHALVFGASGISGNALCAELLHYPSTSTFARVTGLTNRPLSVKQAALPADPRLELVSGVDLTKDVEEVEAALKSKVKDISGVTHVFFMAYVQTDSHDTLVPINVGLLKTGITAVNNLAPHLQHVILQTGGKAYGVEFANEVKLQAPFKESQPRLPEPYASKIFYYGQVDVLSALSKANNWTWTEVRPDVIVGFVPTSNAMNAAGPLAYYLSLYRHIHGEGATIPFPASEASWTSKHNDSSATIIAQFEIYAALNAKKAHGRAFNIADGEVLTWETKWPGIVSYFGLKGVGPDGKALPPDEFFKENAGVWEEIVKKNGLVTREETSWWFLKVILGAGVDRAFDLTAARSIGFTEKISTVEGYTRVFEKMRVVKYIP